MFNIRTKKFLLFLLIATVIALAIRLVVANDLYSFNAGHNAVQTPPATTDMATYMDFAQRISNGTYSGEFNYQPFYYAVALPVVNFICGNKLWGVIWFQALLGAITCLLTGLCAAECCGRRGGYIATGLTVFCGIMICYTPFHLLATLQSCWIILLFYAVIMALKRGKLTYWGVVGLLTGCAILTRGNIWFFVPGIVLSAIYSGLHRAQAGKIKLTAAQAKVTTISKQTKPTLPTHSFIGWRWRALTAIMPLILLVVFIIIPQIPFAWHNSVVLGHISGPSTAADQVLALGNTKESPPGGRNPEYLAGPMEYPPSYGLWMNPNNRKQLSVPRRIINWFIEQPGAYIELSFRKLLLFWDHREIPNNISYIQVREQSPWLRRLGFISSGLVFVCALAGLLLYLPRVRYNIKLFLLYYFIITYWWGTAAFYILARFRMPLLPLLAIAAALGIEWLLRHRKNGRQLLRGAAAFLIGYFICYHAYDFYRTNLEASIIRLTRPHGIKVKMSANSYMLLDNGPMTFGGWRIMPLTTAISVNKIFKDLPKGKITSIKLELPLIAASAGSAVIAINDKNDYITFLKPGMQKFTFNLAPSSAGNITLHFIGGTTDISVITDYQRNYGRTRVNAKPYPAELVCRIFCTVK